MERLPFATLFINLSRAVAAAVRMRVDNGHVAVTVRFPVVPEHVRPRDDPSAAKESSWDFIRPTAMKPPRSSFAPESRNGKPRPLCSYDPLQAFTVCARNPNPSRT